MADKNVLSQEEIDALLKTVGESQEEDHPAAEAQTATIEKSDHKKAKSGKRKYLMLYLNLLNYSKRVM